jgi:DNA-binding PadR family transcriptional regulator
MEELNYKQKIILNFLISGYKKPMSPLQLMKSIFLYAQEEKPKDFYEFIPYLYGPCSFDVYTDLKLLEVSGYIASYTTHRGWSFFGITSEGEKYLLSNKKILQKLDKIKGMILSKPFIELLKYVYSIYPEFAQNSIFNSEALKKL